MVNRLRWQVEQPNIGEITQVHKIDPEVWKDRIKRLNVLRDLVAKHIDDERDKQKRRYNKGWLDVSKLYCNFAKIYALYLALSCK